MKFGFLIFAFVFLALSTQAEDSTKTQAGWFSPDCSDCSKLQTPGTANLGNNKGVYRPGKKNQKKPTSAQPVDTTQ